MWVIAIASSTAWVDDPVLGWAAAWFTLLGSYMGTQAQAVSGGVTIADFHERSHYPNDCGACVVRNLLVDWRSRLRIAPIPRSSRNESTLCHRHRFWTWWNLYVLRTLYASKEGNHCFGSRATTRPTQPRRIGMKRGRRNSIFVPHIMRYTLNGRRRRIT